MIAAPESGQIARVRQRLYLVEKIVLPQREGERTLVRLSCVDDDAQGQPLEVLWEREIDREIITGEAWESIAKRGFDQPKLFAAYLNTLRWNCVTSTDPRLFQSPFRAGIRLDAYQLEPLRKALRLPRVNLFIADDVGLGKTIEAGLIARELLLRKKAREIIVSCTPSMIYQWKDELESRFGLTFEVLDKDYMKQIRLERGFGVNPWSTHSRFLVSHRLLIDEAYVGPLRDWLGDFRSGTLLILDEAHHAAPSSGQKYAIDSHITRAIRDIAPRFEHRLFLSATPHNGHSNSFTALLEILDPQRFFRSGKGARNRKPRSRHTSLGGCQPASTQYALTISASGSSARCRAATVARPVGVSPTTRMPSADQQKCSDQRCVRGLIRTVSMPDSGSRADVRSETSGEIQSRGMIGIRTGIVHRCSDASRDRLLPRACFLHQPASIKRDELIQPPTLGSLQRALSGSR